MHVKKQNQKITHRRQQIIKTKRQKYYTHEIKNLPTGAYRIP